MSSIVRHQQPTIGGIAIFVGILLLPQGPVLVRCGFRSNYTIIIMHTGKPSFDAKGQRKPQNCKRATSSMHCNERRISLSLFLRQCYIMFLRRMGTLL